YTTFLHYKYNELQDDLAPSPVGEGWGEENKNNYLYPPHPNLLPQGRRLGYLCRYLSPQGEGLALLKSTVLTTTTPHLKNIATK
ncbi:MAG: hypothetical protein Q7U66_00055, partial [Methylobacter sp.]|nr:hypothetical protein [Methylobacter sp.]